MLKIHKKIFLFELFFVLVVSLIFLHSNFLDDINSSAFKDLREKMMFNYAFIILWLILNHFLIFFSYSFKILNYSKANLVLLCSLSISFLTAALNTPQLRSFITEFYYYFGIGHLYPVFIDLRGVLAGINKANDMADEFKVDCLPIEEPCIGWDWSYGTPLLFLRNFFVFEESNTRILALIIFAIYIFVIFRISRNLITRNVMALLSITAVSLITIERMNIDIIGFMIVCLVAKVKRFKSKLSTFFLLICFSLAKYYTFCIIPIVILLEKSSRLKYVYTLLTLIAIPISYRDIRDTSEISFGYAATFGLKSLIGIITGASSPTFFASFFEIVLFCLLFISLIIFFLILYSKESKSKNIDFEKFEIKLFIYNFAILFFAWLVASNYPYRLIFILGTIPFLVNYFKSNKFLLILNLNLCFMSMNTLPISLSVIRNCFISCFLASIISLCLLVGYYQIRLLLKNHEVRLNS